MTDETTPAVVPPQACRDCRHYDLEATKGKSGRVLPQRRARCRFPLERIVMPAAMGYAGQLPPIPPSHMGPDEGGDCRTFERSQATQ